MKNKITVLSVIKTILALGLLTSVLCSCVATGGNWVPGHYGRFGQWIPGHYVAGPVAGPVGGVWVPGHYGRFSQWIPGHWR